MSNSNSNRIGPYLLIKRLGSGAFGAVWLAEKQTAIATTRVALKLPRDVDVDIAAVRHEATVWVQASGHPNVLPIIDADIYGEQVVIVSEYAPDGSLSKWMERHGNKAESIETATDMVDGILAGLEHLHRRRIIHRDLKPDNILLQGDTPRLADFGIARILKTSTSTAASGTPAYMAPEAFDGKRSEQTDLWSVGVIFYQLLCGSLPFTPNDMASLLKAILTAEPEPLPLSIPEPIRRVVRDSLIKDPIERYKSATEMRQALRKIRQSITSPESQATVETLPIPLPTVRSPIQAAPIIPLPTISAEEAVSIGRDRQKPLNVRSTVFSTFSAALRRNRNFSIVGGLILAVVIGIASLTFFRGTANVSLRRQLAEHKDAVQSVAFSADGQTLASGSADKTINLWDTQSGALKRTLSGHSATVSSVAFSYDGKALASGSRDGTVRVWDVLTGQQSQVLSEGSSPVNTVSFSPKERIVACGSDDGVIRLWDIDSGVLKMRLALRSRRSVLALSFSPDGQMLASGGSEVIDEKITGGEIDVWDTHRWNFINALVGHTDVVTSLAFSSDNRTLASGSRDGNIKIWDVPTGNLKNTISGHQGGVSSVSFSPDRTTLVSGGKDDAVRLWDVQTGQPKQTYPLTGNGGEVFAVTFSSDGKTIASGHQDHTIRLWY